MRCTCIQWLPRISWVIEYWRVISKFITFANVAIIIINFIVTKIPLHYIYTKGFFSSYIRAAMSSCFGCGLMWVESSRLMFLTLFNNINQELRLSFQLTFYLWTRLCLQKFLSYYNQKPVLFAACRNMYYDEKIVPCGYELRLLMAYSNFRKGCHSQYSWTPVTRIAKGNWNYFELSGFRFIGVLNKKTRNTWLKRFYAYICFIVRFLAM